ncbi:hypothetical protein QDR37_06000 [Amnibacterium sp. CER49]|uniref:hypothetical protein n=1 Tax=Amnibacterium sp. CER49 TaxID=3039161 RepID=UPI00244894FA|nr:hypothetical protein [Amnibacterium sp. CER49]MDH2443493.1 hypothetical protein [Amnibacterium sp. CER49]
MKRRILVWVLSGLAARVLRRRGTRPADRPAARPFGDPFVFGGRRTATEVRDAAEQVAARVWPLLDTPANRARGQRFVQHMRETTARRA